MRFWRHISRGRLLTLKERDSASDSPLQSAACRMERLAGGTPALLADQGRRKRGSFREDGVRIDSLLQEFD